MGLQAQRCRPHSFGRIHHTPHDGSGVRPSLHLRESCLAEGGQRTGVGKDIRRRAGARVHGIPLNDAHAFAAGVPQRRSEQRHRDAFPPVGLVHEKTDHRPHWLLVHPFEDAGSLQSGIGLPWGDGAPADGPPVYISQEAGRFAGLDDGFVREPVALALLGSVLGTGDAPPHAPAPARRAPGAKELLQVGPPLRRDRHGLKGRVLGIASGQRRFHYLRPAAHGIIAVCAPIASGPHF